MALLKNFLQTTSVNFPTSWDAFSRAGDDQSRAQTAQPPAASASVFGPENQPEDTSEDASGSLEDDFALRRLQEDAAARWQQAQRNATAPARRNRANISESCHSRKDSRSPAPPTTRRTSKSPMRASRLRESKSMDMDSTHSTTTGTGPDGPNSSVVSKPKAPMRRTRTSSSVSPKRGCLDRASSHTSRASTTNQRAVLKRTASHTSRGSTRSPNGLDAPSSLHRKHAPRGRNPSLDAHVGQRSNSVRRTQSSVASRLTHSTTSTSSSKPRRSTSGNHNKKSTIRKSKSMDDTSMSSAASKTTSRMKVTRTDSSSSNGKWADASDPLKGKPRPSVAQREFSMQLFKASTAVDNDKVSEPKKEEDQMAITTSSPKEEEPTEEEGESKPKRISGSKHGPSAITDISKEAPSGEEEKGADTEDTAKEPNKEEDPLVATSCTKDEVTEEDGDSKPKRSSESTKSKHRPSAIKDICQEEPSGEGNGAKRRSRSSNPKRRPTATDGNKEQPNEEATRARSTPRSADEVKGKDPPSEEQEEGERRRSESVKPKHRTSSSKRSSSSKPKERPSLSRTNSSRSSHQNDAKLYDGKKKMSVRRCTSGSSTKDGKRPFKRSSSARSRSSDATIDCMSQWNKVVAEQEVVSKSTDMPSLQRSATTGTPATSTTATFPPPPRHSFFASLKQALGDNTGEEEATVMTMATCSSRKSKMSCHSLPVPCHREAPARSASLTRAASLKLRRQSTNPNNRSASKDHPMKDNKGKRPVRRTLSAVDDKRFSYRRTLSSDSVGVSSCIEGEERKHHQRKKKSIHRTASHSSRTPSRSPNRSSSISRQSSSRKQSQLGRSQSPKRISSFDKKEPATTNQEMDSNQPKDSDSNTNEATSQAA